MRVLAFASACEAPLALALLLDPSLVFRWLLGAKASPGGPVMGRVAGIALLGLVVACWPGRRESADRPPALRAMLIYNALATLYLLYLGIGGEWVGPLLWPAALLHALLTLWCLVALRPRRVSQALVLALGLCVPSLGEPASAHDARPAYLQIEETTPGRYHVLWRTPVLSGMRLPVVLKLPDGVRNVTEPAVQELSDSLVERRLIEANAGTLAGARMEFPGLQATITDVLVRVALLDGSRSTTLVRPSRPWLQIATASGSLAVAGAYLLHGAEHILLGFDHLLFVLALILIVRSTRVLVMTITAFTIAHSFTLALATLGVVHVPGPPVEAAIALSILLLASEILRTRRGDPSATARWPWVVAFAFGLLHGFGFAGALTAVGLPQGDIPLALFAFNVGVEVGQLAFIAAILALTALARWLELLADVRRRALPMTAYAVGTLAAFWFFERLGGFVP
jgi:hydrogenase/urease accessory protein HupE